MRFNRRRKDARTRTDGKQRMAGRNRWTRNLETLERRELLAVDSGLATPLHNVDYPLDVNHDNQLTPLDVLVIFNDLLSNGVHSVPNDGVKPLAAGGATASSVKYVDVTGDNMVTPLDALRVINALAVDDQAQIKLVTTDQFGTPITQIPVGSTFQLARSCKTCEIRPISFRACSRPI